ncbi:MAG: isochorismatase family protein [Bacteroidota bacterium]|jgi:nicotinamidase-related amidase
MYRSIILSFLLLPVLLFAQTNSKTALLLIDIQDFYFPGGRSALFEPDAAANQAALLLKDFRSKNQLIIHVKHQAELGADIHMLVKPFDNEKVITKKQVNSFKDTDLLDYLKENQIDTLVMAGMQTHMCLEAAVRAAHDFGFICLLIEDACATKDLNYNGHTIAAKDVHLSTLHTLRAYSKIYTTSEFLNTIKH